MTASNRETVAALQAIGRQLQTVIAAIPIEPAPLVVPSLDKTARAVRHYLSTRRLRDLYFPPRMFADASWDILLDLYVAHQERGLVSISSACIAAAVPPTTALRDIRLLELAGIVHRTPDPFDRRRAYLELSDAGLHAMQDYFAAVARIVAMDGSRR